MSSWILYDEFVELVRNHHFNAFSGLITGISDSKHSFQVGFDRGEIVLLTYRIRKGLQALPLITRIERAKITDHPSADIQDVTGDALDTGEVLSQLIANTLNQTTTTTTDISDISASPRNDPISIPRKLDPQLRKIIESAARHHFGPIGARVSEEHLANLGENTKAILLAIARDVGASEEDIRAFFKSVSRR